MNKKLFLIRHAEVDLKYRGRYLGSTNAPLSEDGLIQATELGRTLVGRFREPRVWISPLLRCQQTWTNLQLKPPAEERSLDELREINFGDWEGKSFNEICALDEQAVEGWSRFDPTFSFPNGESLSSFIERMNWLKKTIVESFESPCNEIVLITHGGVIATLICLFLGLDPSQYLLFRIGRPSISELTVFSNGKAVLEALNLGRFERHGEWPG